MNSRKNSLLIFLLLFTSAFLFAVSFPGFIFKKGFSAAAWFCFVPLFIATDKMTFKGSFLWGLFYGFVSYGFLVFWLFNYSFWIFLLALAFYGILYGLLFPVLVFSGKSFNKANYLLKAFLLISFEFLKTLGFFGFSYGIMGYTQWQNLKLIQIADITGVYGISAILILSSALIARLVKIVIMRSALSKKLSSEHYDNKYSSLQFQMELENLKKKQGTETFIAGSALMVMVLAGVLIYGGKKGNGFTGSEKVKICAVQHNENSREEGIAVYANNVSKLMELTDEALLMYPDISLVVWPETAVTPSIMYQYYYGKDERRVSLVNKLLNYFEGKKASFVIGNFHAEKRREAKGTDDFNSAFYFVPGKNVLPPSPEAYYKQHLVPMSEAFPFEKHFLFLKKFMESLGANFWVRGTEFKTFEHEGLRFSTPICFEDTFPALCRNMVMNGSRCFINLTNDSWSKSQACQYQHLSMAVFRSVENKVPSVRSATSGVTAIISPEGKIEMESPSFCLSCTVGTVPVIGENNPLTFYSKYGDLFAYGILILTGVLLIIGIIRGIIKTCQNR